MQLLTKGVFILFKSSIKRVVCMFLILGLAFSSSLSVASQAAKKTKLKTKKITMKVGQKKKIVINGKKKKLYTVLFHLQRQKQLCLRAV